MARTKKQVQEKLRNLLTDDSDGIATTIESEEIIDYLSKFFDINTLEAFVTFIEEQKGVVTDTEPFDVDEEHLIKP